MPAVRPAPNDALTVVVGQRRRRGVSLWQMLATVTLLGVVAGVAVPRLSGNSAAVKKNSCYAFKGFIEVQAQLWFRNKGAWPATNLADIAADKSYFPEGLLTCPVDGSAYTLDSTTHKVTGHNH